MLLRTMDVARVWASARFWECCKFEFMEINEKARCYERMGIVSYSVGESDMRWEWARVTGHIIRLHGRLATSHGLLGVQLGTHC